MSVQQVKKAINENKEKVGTLTPDQCKDIRFLICYEIYERYKILNEIREFKKIWEGSVQQLDEVICEEVEDLFELWKQIAHQYAIAKS